MGRGIIKISHNNEDWYLEWSTVVDAPVSWGMTIEELIQDMLRACKHRYINFDDPNIKKMVFQEISGRLDRLDKKGTSFYHYSDADAVIKYNRAGANETCFTKDQIIKWYCKLQKEPDEAGKTWEEIENEQN